MEVRPPVYFDYNNRSSDEKFVFISYSHRNQKEVFEDLNKLYDLGVNYWYDENLVAGDKWNEVVAGVLLDKRCIGALFFLSKDSLKSEAVHKEMQLAKSRSESDEPYLILSINFDGLSIMKLVLAMLNNIDAKDLSKYQKPVVEILQLFPSEKIYIQRNDANDYISKIADALKSFNPKLVSNKTSYLEQLSKLTPGFIKQNEVYMFYGFGDYVRNRIANNLGVLYKEGFQEIRKEKYIGLNRQYFAFEKLDWVCVDYQNDIITFASTEIIDFQRFNDINSLLRDVKSLIFLDINFEILPIKVGLIETKHIGILKDAIPRIQCTKFVQAKSRNQCIGLWVKNNEGFEILSEQYVPMKINNIQNYSAGIVLTIQMEAKKLIQKFGG